MSSAQELKDVLITDELGKRPSRPANYLVENQALIELAQALVAQPEQVLQRIADLTLKLCRTDSAAVSILEPAVTSNDMFRWHAIAGEFSVPPTGTISRNGSPCGIVVAHNTVLLFNEPDRFFPELRGTRPRIHEVLVVPWRADGQVVGTIWAIEHHAGLRFDREDARVLQSLARFAAAGWSLMQRRRAADDLRAERLAALNLMEDALSARKEAERANAALRESEERSRLIVESARDYAIFTIDLDRRVSSWNSGAERLFGYSEPEILGLSADVVFTPEDLANGEPAREAAVASHQGGALNERWYVRKDGSRFWGSGMTAAMHDATGRPIGFLKIKRDQTERLLVQESLERSKQELLAALKEAEEARSEAEAAGRAKDHFLAALSHELRTPLTPVLMAVHTLAVRDDFSPDLQQAFAMIRRNIETEVKLMDDLLDLTRISRGGLEIVREPLELHEVVRDALEIVRQDLETREQLLNVLLSAARTQLIGDAVRLQQVFWNLLKNAAKFTPRGGAISVRSWNENDRALVAISDTGIGFEPEVADRVFEPFVQESHEITRRFGGLGIGLAISRAIIHAHGGTIRAESPGHDQGSTFTVDLPVT
ncbi:MAG: PAS domain S-box protein [Verrucomicrobia bacterium]|nr:PAS domain S-box protein [Verrucomicrobiota bacterium]